MTYDRRKNEEDQSWRQAELVISYPNWGDRGRMRGSSASAPGTLHRPTCRFMTVGARLNMNAPSNVYDITLESWAQHIEKTGSYTEYKVCQVCCPDLIGSVPIVVKDPRGRLQRYDSTNAYKLTVLMIELNEARAAEKKMAEQMAVITVTVNTLLAKVTEVAKPLDMGIVAKDGSWFLKKMERVS